MSTLKVSALQHPSSASANITLNSDGTVANVAGMGKVLQVVQTVKTDTFTSASSTFVDITGLTVSITPSSASNKVLLLADVFWSAVENNTPSGAQFKLAGGNAGNYVGDAAGSRTQALFGVEGTDDFQRSNAVYLDSPATTSSITYSVQTRGIHGRTVYVNRTRQDDNDAEMFRSASSITAIEIAG